MPFVKCPECGKLNSIKLKNCPKCEASLDIARASYNNTHSMAAGAAGNPAISQNTPWGQPAQQPAPQPQNNPWGQPAQQPVHQPQNNPWGQPAQQHAPQPQNNPWGQPAQQHAPQPQNNPWGQPAQQHAPQPQGNPWGQPIQQPAAQPQGNTWGQPVAQNPELVAQCPTCGNRIVSGARFCASCGTPIPQPAPRPAGIPTRKNPYCL